ncbi:MAG: hypothetical protein J0M18_12985 [Ignavibacteria bacterium]|jgi:hypothetical protein|nr:hypothetical protein [Ignavibacteria bacterium]
MKYSIAGLILVIIISGIIIVTTSSSSFREAQELTMENQKIIKEENKKAHISLKYTFDLMPQINVLDLELDSVNFALKNGMLLILSNDNCSDCINYVLEFIQTESSNYKDFHTIIQNQTELEFANQFKDKYKNIYLDNKKESNRIINETLAHTNPVLFFVYDGFIVQAQIVYNNNLNYVREKIKKFKAVVR